MNIAFAAQKGGVGKSTLAMLFSNYSSEKGKTTLCLDYDPQASLHGKWNAAIQSLTDEPPVTVLKCDMEDAPLMMEKLEALEDTINIFDMPGSLEDPKLPYVLNQMELIICPFLYEEMSFNSTLVFAQIVKALELRAKIVFIPNIVKTNVRYELIENVEKELSPFGEIAPPISDWVIMQRIDFFNFPEKVTKNVGLTFDKIWAQYIRNA